MNLFDEGWEKLRERIFANQKRLGVIPANAQLTPWPDALQRWDNLSADEKRLFLRQVNVYAAYMAYVDAEIGRVVAEIERLGQLDNTLIIFVTGDNGASAEGQLNGTPNEATFFNGVEVPVAHQLPVHPDLGQRQDLPALRGWLVLGARHAVPLGQADRVAFRRHAQRHGRFTGRSASRTRGGIRQQFHHVIDVIPTILEAVGIPDGRRRSTASRRTHSTA